MVKVFITVDTEIWCDGWVDIDKKFPAAFRKYVYGPTSRGDYGLPIQLKILNDCGLKGIFFVEPLFALRFGIDPLAELVGLLQDAGQEIQLHLHPEWVNEAIDPVFDNVSARRFALSSFTMSEQSKLIGIGKELLHQAGVGNITSFRAGSYAVNRDTLKALAANNIPIDTSYNAASSVGVADISPGKRLVQPYLYEDIYVYPVSFFQELWRNKFRHLQLTACSIDEIKYVLDTAYQQGWDSVVLVSHNFELMNEDKTQPYTLVVDRFIQLSQFLSSNRDRFEVCGMEGLQPMNFQKQPDILVSNVFRTARRMLEQQLGVPV